MHTEGPMSMLALPQMTAEVFVKRFGSIMWLSIGISLACSLAGLMLATVIDVPCSALIVLTMAAVYLIAWSIRRFFLEGV